MYNANKSVLGFSLAAFALGAFATGCGGSYPVPTQRMADAQSATRSARELGAEKQPQAALHLKLAEEQTALANSKLKEDDNKRADFLLLRAKADAELALAIANEEKANADAKQATEQEQKVRNSFNNPNQGVAR